MLKSIYTDVKVTPVALNGAADNEAINTDVVDTAGYDAAAFIAVAEEGEAQDFTLKAQQGAKSDGSDAADLKGTSVTFSTTVAARGEAVLDIGRPQARYLRGVLTVPDCTAAKAVAVFALLYNAREVPVSNTGEFHASPDEGTA